MGQRTCLEKKQNRMRPQCREQALLRSAPQGTSNLCIPDPAHHIRATFNHLTRRVIHSRSGRVRTAGRRPPMQSRPGRVSSTDPWRRGQPSPRRGPAAWDPWRPTHATVACFAASRPGRASALTITPRTCHRPSKKGKKRGGTK